MHHESDQTPTLQTPRLARSPLGIALRVVVAVGILIFANIIAGALPMVALTVPGAAELFGGNSPWAFVVMLGVQGMVLACVVLCVWAWMRWIERSSIHAVGWRWDRRSIAWLMLGVTVSAVVVLSVIALLPPTGAVVDGSMLPTGAEEAPIMIAILIVYYLGLAFVQQSIPEELLFRGMLVWSMRERPVRAIVVSTLAFTVIHLVSSGGQESALEFLLYLALPFGFSLLAVGLLLWTGSLWAAIGVHGGFHVGNYLATVLVHQVDAVPSWLWVGGCQAAIGLALIVTAFRRGRRLPHGESQAGAST